MNLCPVTDHDKTLRAVLLDQARLIAQARNGGGASWQYKSIEALVLAHGRFVDLSLTTPLSYRNGQPRECFKNAYRLADSLSIAYVEGFALTAGLSIPFAHAWCVDDDGALLEPTWLTIGIAYLGIPFSLPFTSKTIAQRNRYGVLDAPDLHWPLLQHGLPEGAKANYV